MYNEEEKNKNAYSSRKGFIHCMKGIYDTEILILHTT